MAGESSLPQGFTRDQLSSRRVYRALVIGASGGIGAASASTLAGRGVEVVALSRSQDGLEVTQMASVDHLLGELAGPFDLILVATGILTPDSTGPEKSLDQIDAARMAEVLAVNTIGPALILRHAPRLLPRNGRSVVAVLTARVGSIGDNGIGGWYSYRASKAAANQIVRTAAIEIGRRLKDAAVVALHPGTVATPFTSNYPGHRKVAPEVAAKNLLRVIDGIGPEHTGRFYDWSGAEVPW
ncbi:SDR family NAD(P)-dependent oxidoreductase [Defluviimonas sp. D31]|uniref:SDR family NAD(P)-dependent oxidoreductase n=1 Tax=Defluviimonas sp. D31 TaxID=3083253 RepID=UPI00296E6C41|nr:SDR family NAD(P)-dependent oxidoreductase [Defluviimonas sp. D31]MDW4551615.1 SDR family NAD(P)-dependent oxidoreductase [Defluviimonas sp. D31]